MARQLDLEKLSKEDYNYITQRPWLVEEANQQGYVIDLKKKTCTRADGSSAESDEGEEISYEDYTVAELKEELKERELSTEGNKAELVARLEEDDENTD